MVPENGIEFDRPEQWIDNTVFGESNDRAEIINSVSGTIVTAGKSPQVD